MRKLLSIALAAAILGLFVGAAAVDKAAAQNKLQVIKP